jgi:hypothetical protein
MESADPFTEQYASMHDDELRKLSYKVETVPTEAREALRRELELRHFAVKGIDWTAQPKPKTFGATTRRVFRNLGIYLVCDIAWMAIFLYPVSILDAHGISGAPAAYATFFIDVYLRVAILLALLTGGGMASAKVRTIWIIGIAGPPATILLTLLYGLYIKR